MPEVKVDAAKFQSRAAAASGDYGAGVRSPKRSQSEAAIASEGNYEAGVNAAIARKGYSAGLRKAGDAAWQKGVTEKGQQRFAQGVGLAGQKWATEFGPFAQAIRSTSLTPRGPKGTNYTRVQEIGEALRKTKTGGA